MLFHRFLCVRIEKKSALVRKLLSYKSRFVGLLYIDISLTLYTGFITQQFTARADLVLKYTVAMFVFCFSSFNIQSDVTLYSQMH